MRVAVATTQGGLEDVVSPIFGRCPTFTLVDVENGEVVSHEVVQNPYVSAMGGAGIQAAQLVISKGAQAILAGAFGPNASNVFSQGGVQTIPAQGTVEEKVLEFAAGRLVPTAGPTAAAFTGRGMGTGGGMGMGRGMGMARGMGMPGMPMSTPPAAPPPSADAIATLSEQLRSLTLQLEELSKRIETLERSTK